MKTLVFRLALLQLSANASEIFVDEIDHESQTQIVLNINDEFQKDFTSQIQTLDGMCPRFKCADKKSQINGQMYCYKSDINDPLKVDLKKCPEGQFCHGILNKCSFDPYMSLSGKYPGTLCQANFECQSNNCIEGVCYGKSLDDECNSHADCEVGLFCSDKNMCIQQIGLNGNCQNDLECLNNLACGNGSCQSYGSLSNGQSSDNELLCKSGFISNQFNTDNNEFGSYCMETPVITSHQGQDFQCASTFDSCIYESRNAFDLEQTHSFQEQCQCGLTTTGKAFCPYIFTDTFTDLLAQVSNRISVGPRVPCHTSMRHEIYECLILNIDSPQSLVILEDFIIQKFEREENQNVHDNDQCMRKHSKISQYWEAQEHRTLNPEFHTQVRAESARLMQQPSFAVLILSLLLMVFISRRN